MINFSILGSNLALHKICPESSQSKGSQLCFECKKAPVGEILLTTIEPCGVCI